MYIQDAIESLQNGGFILIHDAESRENEFDMAVAAQHITPAHVATMRSQAGGLLCVAIGNEMATRLHLPYMHEMLAESGLPAAMIQGLAPYGDHPTFSIYVNHTKSYTGVTDTDRARTIREMAKLYGVEHTTKEFVNSFRTPGHVPLLIASKDLLMNRTGHTEMSVYMAQAAGLWPAAAICEMMDSETHLALDMDGATTYAKHHNIPIVELHDILDHARIPS